MSSPQPVFVQKDAQPDGTVYEVYRGTDGESARSFLASRQVTQANYYILVETPAGNWGTDIHGLYLERLLAWQTQLDLAACEGAAQPYSVFGLEMAARGINDNFVVKVHCGKCGHTWIDGIRYQNVTVVRCPNCSTYNKVDSSHMEVISTQSLDMAAKFQQAIEANGRNDAERALQLFKECYDNDHRAAECAASLGLLAFNHLQDIEQTGVWLHRAANLGSKQAFVYLYLVEIYQGQDKICPREYYQKSQEGGTALNPETIRKIRTMCGQAPSDSFTYKIG